LPTSPGPPRPPSMLRQENHQAPARPAPPPFRLGIARRLVFGRAGSTRPYPMADPARILLRRSHSYARSSWAPPDAGSPACRSVMEEIETSPLAHSPSRRLLASPRSSSKGKLGAMEKPSAEAAFEFGPSQDAPDELNWVTEVPIGNARRAYSVVCNTRQPTRHSDRYADALKVRTVGR
jgi:hypothetical protein